MLFVATVFTHLAAFHIPFMRLLQEWGYEVHAAASPTQGRKEEMEAAGVICHDVPFARSSVRADNIRAYRAVKALLDRVCFDLTHVHTPMAAWVTRLAAHRARQRPVLYTAHGFHFYRGAPWTYWLFYYPAERIARRWTDGLIVMNGEDYAQASRMGFQPGEDLFRVHGVGVDLTQFASGPAEALVARQKLGLGSTDLVVACVAEFNSNKNQAQLIGAWPRVIREVPRAQLLLVGEGPLRGALQKQVVRAGVPNVWFFGYRDDVAAILSASDVFVLPSRREGLPRSIQEAMAAGKPVVATDVRGSRDLVEDGVTGLLVKVGDVDATAQAIARLLTDDELRRRMGEAARGRVQQYALDRVLVETAQIYRRYLSGSQVPGSDLHS